MSSFMKPVNRENKCECSNSPKCRQSFCLNKTLESVCHNSPLFGYHRAVNQAPVNIQTRLNLLLKIRDFLTKCRLILITLC